MKKWDEQTPIMSSAALMKVYRYQLWGELKEHPEWNTTQVNKIKGLICALNKRITKRSYNLDKVIQFINEVERQKISKRAAKFTSKQIKNKNGKSKLRQKPFAKQAEIFAQFVP